MKQHIRPVTRMPAVAQQTGFEVLLEAKEEILGFFISLAESISRSWPWGIVFPPTTT